jgi:PAS domain S-box-containing protein
MEQTMSQKASDRLHEQLNQVREQLNGTGQIRQRQLAEAIQALQQALQEVEVAEEELSRQNEELMTAREALEIERARFQDLFEGAPVGYVVTDVSGVIRQVNRTAVKLLNSNHGALQGKPLAVVVDRQDRSAFRSLLTEIKARPARRETEITLQPYHGGLARRVLATVAPDEKPGMPVSLRWVFQDLTERRAAEEALHETQERLRHSQRLEAIGRLAGGVAHSFNNLLAAIAFHSELMLDPHCSRQDLDRHAMEIQKAGERAAALASQLLAFSRKQALNPDQLRLAELVGGLESMLRRLLGEDIELAIETSPSTGLVYADLGQLEQVILNLVANARDAMLDGGRLTLRTETAMLGENNEVGLPAGPYVILSVADTGLGMDPEVLAQIFEPFFTTKEKGKGTGLGLSTVYGIVRQSGGDIQVESTPGRGTTFTIYLPQVGEISEARQLKPQERRASPGSETILLVEDEDNIREPATEILEAQGYQILAARDGAEALELAESHKGSIHLMITDVVMPKLSGSRLAAALQPQRPGMRVLYISGYPEDAIAHHGVLEPRHRFLQKPFPPGVLLHTVRDMLNGVDLDQSCNTATSS